MKRALVLATFTICLFFSTIANADASARDAFAIEGSAGFAAGSLFGISTYGGYGSFDVGLKHEGLLLYGDVTYEGTRTSDGLNLHLASTGPLLLVPIGRLRIGATINVSYTWFDRVSTRASVGDFGFGTGLQGGVDLVRFESATLSFDVRGGMVLMPNATYPSFHSGISLRF